MKKLLFVSVLILFISTFAHNSKAQDYKLGVGLRLGEYTGLSLKYFGASKNALEGILASHWNSSFSSIHITLLYEIHNQFPNARGLKWFYGGGGHLGFINDYNDHPWYKDGKDNDSAIIGLDGILGLEYTFPKAPVCLSLDWKPVFNLTPRTGFWGNEIALSVRLAIK